MFPFAETNIDINVLLIHYIRLILKELVLISLFANLSFTILMAYFLNNIKVNICLIVCVAKIIFPAYEIYMFTLI